jgi:hypothetical protein
MSIADATNTVKSISHFRGLAAYHAMLARVVQYRLYDSGANIFESRFLSQDF